MRSVSSSVRRSGPGRLAGLITWPAMIVFPLLGVVLSTQAAVTPVVEVEEDVYTYEDARNGADPLWSQGATCLVRWQDRVFASGLQTVAGIPPDNNCRWLLFGRETPITAASPWRRLRTALAALTREPCPLAALDDGRLFLSSHRRGERGEGGGPVSFEFIQFATTNILGPRRTFIAEWAGYTNFTDHTYRSLAADAGHGELALFINGGAWGARWTFMDHQSIWAATGELRWPWGGSYERPEAVRLTHANVLLRDGVLHFCGVSELTEPVADWRTLKRPLLGDEPDLVARRLFYVRSPDIARGLFGPWVEVANCDDTAGTISLGDLWVDREEVVHLVWAQQAVDERLRARLPASATQSHSINYARLRRDAILIGRRTLVLASGATGPIPSYPRFQITPDQRIFVFYYVSGTDGEGRSVSENRLLEIQGDGSPTPPVRVPLAHPLSRYYTATPRGGSPLSTTLDLLGTRVGTPSTVSYARVQLR